MLCAAETGERIGTGFCTRDYSGPGVSPIKQTALPKITAWAYPGPYSLGFTPFRLTAYKNPSTYALAFANTTTKQLKNSVALQVLDGSTGARVLLKSCMDKCVLVKIPLTARLMLLVTRKLI